MAVVEWLADRADGATISDISKGLEIEISIVSRLVATLELDAFVRRMPQAPERYTLGFRLAGAVYRHMSLVGIPDICMPELDGLSREIGELVQLAIVDEDCVRFIAKSSTDQRISLSGLVGRVARPDTMATGKAWLASLPEPERLRVLSRDSSDVPIRSRPNVVDLFSELESVLRDGFAIEIEGNMEDVAAIASPVRLGDPLRVVAVLTVSGPSYRLNRTKLKSFAPSILAAAQRIATLWPAAALARQLGWVPPRMDVAS